MNPEEKVISTTKCSSCGGDAYCYVCIVPFSEELESLRAKLSRLQQEAVEEAALVERLEKRKEELACFIIDKTRCEYKHEQAYEHCKRCNVLYPLGSQPPPTGFGQRMLELAKLADAYREAMNQDRSILIEETERNLLAFVVTKEDQDLLGGEGCNHQ